jgi:hypothetical protein
VYIAKSFIFKKITKMKKVFLFAAFTALTSLSFAQTSKSNWMLGGSGSFTSTTPEGGESTTKMNISPKVGYFVIDNLALGAEVSYTKNSSESNATTTFGPFARYYFASLGTSAKLFGQGEAAFGSEGGESVTQFGVHAGVAYFFNNSIALEGSLGYDNMKVGEAKSSSFGVNVGFQIHFGGK